ncbi:MAG: hypothetical protein IKK45_05290 [Akkermansia sp.]|nr:hypothetical protein [Akkermansia sp.]
MKLHLPLSLRSSLFALFTIAITCSTAEAGYKHQDISQITYSDFGQNTGRYKVGNTNALLTHIREQEGGVIINYTDGRTPNKLLHGMIDFGGAYNDATSAAISPSAVATCAHNYTMDPYGRWDATFTGSVYGIGTEHAIVYKGIECGVPNGDNYKNSSIFSHSINSTTDADLSDHKITRLSKIITDAPYAEIYDSAAKGTNNLMYYHTGSGRQKIAAYTNNLDTLNANSTFQAPGYTYVTGGIVSANWEYKKGKGTNKAIVSTESFLSNGISQADPLLWTSQPGDSGSPLYVWDTQTETYQYIGSVRGELTKGAIGSLFVIDTDFDKQAIASHTKQVELTETGTVYLNSVSTKGETITDENNETTTQYLGSVSDGTNTLCSFVGLKSGLNTWGNLSERKDTQNWYNYGDSYVLPSNADLFFTENLVFSTKAEHNTIVLNDTVDLGIGYAEFKGGSFSIQSKEGTENTFNHAGYVVNEGAEVHLRLTNTADYMREWRKIGAGDLYIEGSGNNNILLNVGGSGKTYLNRTDNGYAAYNVLVNMGSTVVINDVNQIARDLSFGNRGGTLDMNGNSMEWFTTAETEDNARNGFSINALTEDALVANYKGHSTLTYKETGTTTYHGSFADSENSSLKVEYEGGGVWNLHSIHTNLQHTDSGLLVKNGRVVLSGTHTIHGQGSDNGTDTNRYTHEDDWHYADARMNVSISDNSIFELGSHARLTGDVTVAKGGTYVMREGVRHQMEYLEGGQQPSNTALFTEYYGHKGNTHLEENALLNVEYNPGTTANNTYNGNISGDGNVSVHAANGSFTLGGTNTFTGVKEVIGGTLILENADAAGDLSTNKWKVKEGGSFALLSGDGNTALSLMDSTSSGTLLLTQEEEGTLNLDTHTTLSSLGALEGRTVSYGLAGDTLNIHNLTGKGTLIVQSTLSGNTDLNIDGRGYAGGSVELNKISDYTGIISVGSAGGSMALSVTRGEELSGLTVNILSGGILQAKGEQETLAGHLNFSDGSTLKGNEITLTQGAHISGTVTGDVDTLTTASGATLNIAEGANLTVRNMIAEGDIELSGNMNYNQLVVQNGATLQLRAGGRLDAENAATISGSGTMQLNAQTLQDNVELKNGATIFGNGGTIGTEASVLATEGTGILSAGTGTLTINGQIGAAENATLVLAGNTITINTINPEDRLNGYINSNGGVLDVQCGTLNLSHNRATGTQTIAGVTLHIGGTVRISEHSTINASPNNYTAHPFYNFNRIEIASGKTLTINENQGPGWSNHWNIGQLTGEGNIHWKADTWYVSQTRNSHMLLSGENSFKGTLLVDNNNGEGMIQTLELAHDKAATYMSIQLEGNNASNTSGLAINTNNAEVAGIQSNAYSAIYTGAAKNSGNAATSSGLYTLTLTGDGFYEHSGSIAGDATNGLNITMNGSGSQTFSGSSVVVHDVAALKGSLLFTGTPTLHGGISIAQGATLQLGESISLNEGQKLSIRAGEAGSSAVLQSALMLNGGQLSFDAAGLNTDTATLLLENGISFAEGVNTHNIELINTSTLDVNQVYQLSNGDWSGQTVSIDLPKYLNGTISASDTGLSLALGMESGYSLWDGSAANAQQGTTSVFIDSEGSHNLELSENVTIGGLLLPDSTDYAISGSSLTTDNIDAHQARLHIHNTTTASSYSVDGGEIIIEQSGRLNLSGARSGIVALENLSGTGTLGVNLSTNYGNKLAVDADFEGETYVQSGNFTINGSTYGNSLHLANGVNFQLEGGSSVTLEKNLILDGVSQVHQNSGATLTINGKVTGNGTYERKGGGTLTFNGMVDLGTFTQGVSKTSTIMNGATNLDRLVVSNGSLTITGSTAKGTSIGNVSVSGAGEVTIGGNNSQQLKGDINITSGGKLTFSGSGSDVIDYNAGKNIVVDGGTINFGNTRQTIQGWSITLKNGATLSGAGGSYSNSSYTAALDFNNNATINVESGLNNTISANMRLRYGNSRTLTFNVAEEAGLDVSGRMHADNTSPLGILQKKGKGDMTISSQVALGTIQAQDGTLTLNYTNGQNVVGTLDTSMGKTSKGTFKLAKNVALKVTGSIWSCSNSAIALAEGASLTSTQRGVIFSTREGAGEARLACNVNDGDYSLSNSNFELTNGHLKYDSSNDATLLNTLTNSSVENSKGKKLTVDNSNNTLTGVHATAGEITVLNLSSVDLQNLEAAAGLTVGFYTGSTESSSAEANVTVRGTATFGANARLNANLTMNAGSTLQVAAGGLTMGSNVTLTAGGLLGEELLERVQTMALGDSTTLFTSVDCLTLNNGDQSYTYLPGELSTKDNMLASIYFTNLTSDDYVLTFSGSGEGNGTLSIAMVPEPASATLSLLALAAMATRRRRK